MRIKKPIIALVFMTILACIIYCILYGPDAKARRIAVSPDRILSRAGLGGLKYQLLSHSIDTVDCCPVGYFSEHTYRIQVKDAAQLRRKTRRWTPTCVGMRPARKWYHDSVYGNQEAIVMDNRDVILRADYNTGIKDYELSTTVDNNPHETNTINR